jgi:hypothetical protein
LELVLAWRARTDSVDETLAALERLKELARELAAELAHAYIALESAASDPGHAVKSSSGGYRRSSWRALGGEAPESMDELCDEFVFDAFHYQVLGPSHIQRLGAAPAGARPLQAGMVELTIGEPAEWLPLARDEGRRALAPCLVREEEAPRIGRARAVASGLVARGAEDGLASLPCTGGPLDALSEVPGAAVLRIYPRHVKSRGRRLRPRLPERRCTEAALAWLSRTKPPRRQVKVALEGCMQFPLPLEQAPLLAEECSRLRPDSAILLLGELPLRVEAAHLCLHSNDPNVALAFGGAGASRGELLATFDDFRSLCRELAADLSYGFVTLEPTFEPFTTRLHFTDRYSGEQAPRWGDSHWDRFVLDAFPYQLLGPGHCERLDQLPAGAVAIEQEHAELAIGDPAQWLPAESADGTASEHSPPARQRLRELGRERLAGLLSPDAERPDRVGSG